MKYLSSALVAFAVTALPLPAVASPLLASTCNFFNFEELAAGREQVPHQELVQSIYDGVLSTEQPGREGFIALLESILAPPAVEITGRSRLENGEEWGSSRYYSQGEFFLESKGQRFVTVDGNLYTWREGEDTGSILTRCVGDTFALLTYMIDYSEIMRSTYRDYLRNPEQFNVTEEEESTLLEPREGIYDELFVSMRFIQDPLWMYQLTLAYPNCQDGCDYSDQEQVVMEFDPPTPLPEIPNEVRELPADVTFSPSNSTVRVFMNYL